jgi:hypothetical protein
VGRQVFFQRAARARHRAGSLALTLAITGGIVGLTAAPAAAAASITLTPGSGTAGSNFNISGSGFASSEHLKFTWDSASGPEVAAQVTVNLSGSFSNIQATVPSGSSTGGHTVYATGTGAFPSQATAPFTVTSPPGGGTTTTTTTRPTTTTTHATTTTTSGGGTTPTTLAKLTTTTSGSGGSHPNTPTNPAGGTSVAVDAGVGPVNVQSQTDVLGASLDDGTTTTTRDSGDGEDALGAPFPAVSNGGGGCTKCWGAVAVLLGGIGAAGMYQQKRSRRRRPTGRPVHATTYKRFK